MKVGGYEERPDWPKMGPSLLIATCLILAIRTAKRPATWDAATSSTELDAEIEYAAHLAGRVLSLLGYLPAEEGAVVSGEGRRKP
jgi:hypothetical protein